MIPKIYLRTDRTKMNGNCVVYLSIIINRQRKVYSLNIEVSPENWDGKNCKVYKKDFKHEIKNKLITHFKSKAENILTKSILSDKKITLSDFDNCFTNNLYGSVDFYEFVKNEIEIRVKNSETHRTYVTQLSKMKQFKKELLFSEINKQFIADYKDYMIKVLKNVPNTYHKSISMLKTFANWAVEKELIEKNPFADVKTPKEPGKRDFLNVIEVKKLENFYNSDSINPGVKNVLRYFLFTCYTGLRFQDVLNLKYSDLKKEQYKDKEFSIISIQMHKTGLPVDIPIIPKAAAYMPKMISINQKIFNVKTGTTTRKHLETAANLAGVSKHITFHVARYTVGTTGLENGITIETISDILGHTDITITKRLYAKTDNTFKYKEMLKFED